MTEWILTADIDPELHRGILLSVGREYSLLIKDKTNNVNIPGIKVEECVTIGKTCYVLTRMSSEQEYRNVTAELAVKALLLPDHDDSIFLYSPQYYIITVLFPDGSKRTFSYIQY